MKPNLQIQGFWNFTIIFLSFNVSFVARPLLLEQGVED